MSAQESITTFWHGYPFTEHLEIVSAGHTELIELRMLQKRVICKGYENRLDYPLRMHKAYCTP